eukprot:11219450-Alexandrium_andersonii.AAC.1
MDRSAGAEATGEATSILVVDDEGDMPVPSSTCSESSTMSICSICSTLASPSVSHMGLQSHTPLQHLSDRPAHPPPNQHNAFG